MKHLFTVGHSSHTAEHFLGLLLRHEITALCDVRSFPWSKRNPQFDRENLKPLLKESGISYVFLGKELGARTDDRTCYENGRVQYHRLAATQAFRDGIHRIQLGMEQHRIALVCAERDPITCHRMVLVCRHLRSPEVRIGHIRANGSLESHAATEERMLSAVGLNPSDLFEGADSRIERAYDLQGEAIAYTRPTQTYIELRKAEQGRLDAERSRGPG